MGSPRPRSIEIESAARTSALRAPWPLPSTGVGMGRVWHAAQPEAPPVKFHDFRCRAGQVKRGEVVV